LEPYGACRSCLAMVRLVYTCPETGVVIVGGHFTERALMESFHSAAVVKCPACDREHFPKISECSMYRAAAPRSFSVPLQAS